MNTPRTNRFDKRAPALVVATLAATLTLISACGSDSNSVASSGSGQSVSGSSGTTSGPSLSITSPAKDAALKGNSLTLDVEAKGLSIVKADGDTSGKTGHYHVFIDRDPVAAGQAIPKEATIIHSAEDPIVIPGLSVGTHRIVVAYGDGTHTRIGEAQAETTINVEGPSVHATAPTTSPVGSPVHIKVSVEGLSLVKADGDTSGKSGHLHLFIDRPPTAAGQPIPVEAGIIHTAATEVDVPDLPAGDHIIWVVAGDGVHVPLAANVVDKVTVTVK